MSEIPRAQRGVHRWTRREYGVSLLGARLAAWGNARPDGRLVVGAIHGDEPETAVILSRAIRSVAQGGMAATVILCANPDGVAMGTRGNARGVDLNRNFPTSDWGTAQPVHRWVGGDPQDVELSAGTAACSEPEAAALLRLIDELAPREIVSLHAPLAIIDDPRASDLGRSLADAVGLALVGSPGYSTPGSMGTWAIERDVALVTYELPPATHDELWAAHGQAVVALVQGGTPHRLDV